MSMGMRVSLKVTGDVDMHERHRAAFSPARMRRFHDNVGVYLGQAMHDRLEAQISGEQLRSPGLRQALLQPATTKGGVFESDELHVEVGSNLPHARKIHEGGEILPKTGKALAIPLTDYLKRNEVWPRDLDPGRKKLSFIPAKGKAGLLGVLIDPEGRLGLGTEPLFAIVSMVPASKRPPRPYAYIDAADVAEIKEMWQDHLAAGGR